MSSEEEFYHHQHHHHHYTDDEHHNQPTINHHQLQQQYREICYNNHHRRTPTTGLPTTRTKTPISCGTLPKRDNIKSLISTVFDSGKEFCKDFDTSDDLLDEYELKKYLKKKSMGRISTGKYNYNKRGGPGYKR